MISSILRGREFGALAMVLVAGQALAVEIGRDDFNAWSSADAAFLPGGPNEVGPGNSGLPAETSSSNFLTRTFTPDLSASTPGPTFAPGGFPSSGFDVFGITNTSTLFDAIDESLGSEPNDDLGIVSESNAGGFVFFTDTVNNDNPSGNVSIQWTFDISGFTNLSVALDLAAQGDHEDSDDFTLSASIDGGSAQTLMTTDAVEGQNYIILLDSGTQTSSTEGSFFEADAWTAWAGQGVPFELSTPIGSCVGGVPCFLHGPSGTEITGFHSSDTDMDGFIDLPAGDPNGATAPGYEEFVNFSGGFFDDEAAFEPLVDPLVVNEGLPNETVLTNKFQTVDFPVSGSGTTLTLTLDGNTNGGNEYFIFDNLIITGDAGVAGDFDGDGDVDVADALKGQRDGEDIGTGSDFQTNFGTGSAVAAVAAVPEPTSLALLGLASSLMMARRRSR